MSAETPDSLPAESDAEEEIGRLYETVRRELHLKRVDRAAAAAQELLARQPDSTTAHELMGDVLLAQGKRMEAKQLYQRALELEPANADAELKFAQLHLALSEADRTRRLMESGDLRALRGAANKDPAAAGTRSLFFPGLGQLYNGEYEKGLLTVAAAMPLFGLAIWGIVEFVVSLDPRKDQPMTPFHAILALVGIFGYGALMVWSVWDAWRTARGPTDDTLHSDRIV